MTSSSIDVSKMLAELRNAFLAELPSRLEEIERLILELGNGENFTENFETLYRHVHSIKGSAGTHGLQIISTVCHGFEDEVVKVEDDQSSMNSEMVSSWLGFIDLLRNTIDLILDGVEDFSEIESALDNVRNKDGEKKYSGMLVYAPGLQQQMCLSAFAQLPVNITIAENGHEALGRLLHEKFDFLISNMELPDLNGFALISALRLSSSRNHAIPAVLLTSKNIKQFGRNSDPDFVINKDANMMASISQTTEEVIKAIHS